MFGMSILVSSVAGGGGGVGLAVVLGVGRAVGRGVHRLGLLEAGPVGVGPGEGGGGQR